MKQQNTDEDVAFCQCNGCRVHCSTTLCTAQQTLASADSSPPCQAIPLPKSVHGRSVC
jgi:hypothetical protein